MRHASWILRILILAGAAAGLFQHTPSGYSSGLTLVSASVDALPGTARQPRTIVLPSGQALRFAVTVISVLAL